MKRILKNSIFYNSLRENFAKFPSEISFMQNSLNKKGKSELGWVVKMLLWAAFFIILTIAVRYLVTEVGIR